MYATSNTPFHPSINRQFKFSKHAHLYGSLHPRPKPLSPQQQPISLAPLPHNKVEGEVAKRERKLSPVNTVLASVSVGGVSRARSFFSAFRRDFRCFRRGKSAPANRPRVGRNGLRCRKWITAGGIVLWTDFRRFFSAISSSSRLWLWWCVRGESWRGREVRKKG